VGAGEKTKRGKGRSSFNPSVEEVKKNKKGQT
jgi:hypothetical protein